jgi:predicted Zn-dependent peptidase
MANANGRVLEKLIPILYKGSKYAVCLPIGLSEIIETANQKVIKDFYNKWHCTDNMAVIYGKPFASMNEFFKLYDSVSLKDLQKNSQ